MDYTERRSGPTERPGADPTALNFAAFVLAHEDCADEVTEAGLDEAHLVAWCRGCGQARVFGPAR